MVVCGTKTRNQNSSYSLFFFESSEQVSGWATANILKGMTQEGQEFYGYNSSKKPNQPAKIPLASADH